MKTVFEIPSIMSHLKRDDRGYPIPYFVPIIEGKPDFRYADPKKQKACIDHKLCWICGKPLYQKSFWFISGPMGYKNRISTNTAMHEDCARFSLKYCPHLAFQKAERRSDEKLAKSFQISEKSEIVILVKADKFEVVKEQGHTMVRYRSIFKEDYIYENNKLTKTVGFE